MLNPSLSKTKKSYDWINELNSDWSSALFDSISFEYSSSLNTFIEQIYLSGKEIYPQKDKLFVPFKKCSLKDVKIVIIDNRPVKDLRSSGIGRGIEEKSSLISDLPIELREFRDCIYETVYGNQYSITNFDNSLDEYCDNDMLFLNCSVCVEKDKDYKIIWKHFIRTVIQEINKKNENVAYVFLTGDNLHLREYIDESKNRVFIHPFSTLPSYSSIFTELDEYIEDNYPHYSRIQW
jgi:uracil DNA glycosylase